jgi:hypothetical protein
MGTPNYLGFLQATPKGSPLQAGLEAAFQGYGDVQKLMQTTYQTRAMPKAIEQEQTLEQQKIDKGALEAKYLPTQLEQEQTGRQQEIDTKQLLLKALPAEIRNKISAEQLENAIRGQTIKANNMSAQQNQDVYFSNKIATLRDLEQRGMSTDDVNSQYQNIRKQMISLGENPNSIPKTYDDTVKSIGDSALLNSPSAIEKRKFDEELAKQSLINKGKIDEQKAKGLGDDPGYKSFQTTEGKADSEYASSVNTASTTSGQAYTALNSLYSLASQHPEYFGVASGKVSKGLTDIGNRALTTAYDVVLKEAQTEMKGASTAFRTTTMQKILLQGKPSVDQPYGAFLETIKRHLAEQGEAMQQAKFVNWAENQGVRNRLQLENAWQDFRENSGVVDAKGNYHPEVIGNWAQYFNDHPDRLPPALANAYTKQVQAAAQKNSVINNGGLITPLQNTNQLLVGQ